MAHPFCSKIAVGIAAGCVVLAATPAGAVESPSVGADKDIEVILGMNPGLTEDELVAGLREAAAERGEAFADVTAGVAAEARAAIAEPDAVAAVSPLAASGSSEGDGPEWVMFPRGNERGDILYYDTSTLGYNHGHVAIFDRPAYLTEAPGGDRRSRTIWRQAPRKVPRGTRYYTVGTRSDRRDDAAYRAYHKYRGKDYQSRFWDNKDDGDGKLNCSELVWKAYRYLFPEHLRLDLDSNGGKGVYPKDIRDSGHLKRYKTV